MLFGYRTHLHASVAGVVCGHMEQVLENISANSQYSTEGAQEGEPPQQSLLSPLEAELLAKVQQVASIVDRKKHIERKRLNDALVPRDAPVHDLKLLRYTASSVREKLNGTASPAVANILEGIRMRIDKEAEMRFNA